MLLKVESDLPAKIWHLVGCTRPAQLAEVSRSEFDPELLAPKVLLDYQRPMITIPTPSTQPVRHIALNEPNRLNIDLSRAPMTSNDLQPKQTSSGGLGHHQNTNRGSVPCSRSPCKPAGRLRVVLYQDGGAWGREEGRGSQQNLFAFKQLYLESACVPWIGGHETSCTSFWPSCGGEEFAECESFV